jgi:hypothetical protein
LKLAFSVIARAGELIPLGAPSRSAPSRNRRGRLGLTIGGAAVLKDGAELVIHVVPLSALDGDPNPAFDAISRQPQMFPPVGCLVKSRRRDPRARDFDGYMLRNVEGNYAALGAHGFAYSASLDDVETYLTSD